MLYQLSYYRVFLNAAAKVRTFVDSRKVFKAFLRHKCFFISFLFF